MSTLSFTVYGTPQPQGSAKAFVVRGRARVTSANAKNMPWRNEVAHCALAARAEAGHHNLFAAKHVPVLVQATFVFAKPPSAPKKRTHHVVKPDCDKLLRSIGDALTGIVWQDDSQVVGMAGRKVYGLPERVEIEVRLA